jgi:maltodextrin utilization protein YvdJ
MPKQQNIKIKANQKYSELTAENQVAGGQLCFKKQEDNTIQVSIRNNVNKLENTNEETIDNFIAELFRQMEGYSNTGFEYLQIKWDNEKIEFQDPFVFVNFLEELNN